MRACPFCGSERRGSFGKRLGSEFERCGNCRSIFMQVSAEDSSRLYHEAWDSEEFLRRTEESLGVAQPDERTWGQVAAVLPKNGALLEIGPGSGHLLAAAHGSGRDVVGVEASPIHRDYIRRVWGITTVYETMDEIPQGATFSGIVVINTIEHIYDVESFLRRLGSFLSPDGAIFISTCNADALLAKVCGTMWSMFKQPDHLSFPSAKGMRTVAARAGLKAARVWSHELPFETPLGVAVAVRDWQRERAQPAPSKAMGAGAGAAVAPEAEHAGGGLSKLVARLEPLDFVTPVTSALGIGSSIKALLVRAS